MMTSIYVWEHFALRWNLLLMFWESQDCQAHDWLTICRVAAPPEHYILVWHCLRRRSYDAILKNWNWLFDYFRRFWEYLRIWDWTASAYKTLCRVAALPEKKELWRNSQETGHWLPWLTQFKSCPESLSLVVLLLHWSCAYKRSLPQCINYFKSPQTTLFQSSKLKYWFGRSFRWDFSIY